MCGQNPLVPPVLVASAQDGYLTPKTPFPDTKNLPPLVVPMFGQDITSSVGRAAPGGQNVGSSPSVLIPKMQKLLTIFASADHAGMAKRLFDGFQSKKPAVEFFDDVDLNVAAARHANIQFFCDAALSAPNVAHRSTGKVRIHQALKSAGWDITKLVPPSDLGVPAFNIGNPSLSTGDFRNGLGVMVNGIQYAYVMAQSYTHDAKAGKYCLGLRYLFYDVFGLDDDDLKEYGSASDSLFSSAAGVGITAWWQLQHQHGYRPLVTRIIVDKTYEAPTT